MIEVIQSTQRFKLTECVEFAYTQVLFQKDGATFTAKFFGRGEVDASRLEDIRHIPSESFCPLLVPGCAIAPTPEQCYIKRPNLASFDGGEDLANLVLRELATCEIIRRQPHRNLATYHGCQVSNGRIVGLCFERYAGSLLDILNPDGLNKSDFILSKDRAVVRKQAARYLLEIEQGVRHLHSIGRIHNDLTPANIMISEDGTPVIIDYDSSCAPGKDLDNLKRTYGWYDPEVNVSQASNDFDALAELRVWLTGSSPAEFRFGQY